MEPTHGEIEIDGLDISSLDLQDLRSRLAIIPQDSALFSGTIRSNLDPQSTKDDTELWAALELAHLKPHVETMEGQLDATVSEGGSNLSAGQRQLISLARVVLRGSTVLVLDEATAAVDLETDALVQDSLRGNVFAARTVITIAHRIDTVLDYDKILVLDHGEVAEFDTPQRLLQDGGLFHALVQEAGLEGKVNSA
jgi:ABC-type multidrug transport system fused ATPase/permease subunit